MPLETLVRWGLVAVAGAVAVWLLDRALVRLEAGGWIYYRRRRGSSGSLGAAFLSVQSLVDPGARHAAEERRATRAEADEDGEGPEPV